MSKRYDWQGRKVKPLPEMESELAGAEYAQRLLFAPCRKSWSMGACIRFGEFVHRRYLHKNEYWAFGFREMAYVIAKQRR